MGARATIIIPTYSEAPFIRWSIASAAAQTVRELEICVICDGSPPHMVELIQAIAREDRRIKVFTFPKGARHGEIFRHQVIVGETTGEIICYLSHDDLYLPWHVESLERALKNADFAHSMAVSVATGYGEDRRVEVRHVALLDLEQTCFRESLLDWPRHRWGFGLVFGAHTREAYLRLPEGWAPAPPDIPTDMFMWQKFLRHSSCKCRSHMEVTALHFDRASSRMGWSPEQRAAELAWWFPRTQAPGFRGEITDSAMRFIAVDLARLKGIGGASRSRLLLDLWSAWRSGLFDRDWYLEQNPDVKAAGVNALWHFSRWGGREGRSPGPGFNSDWYRQTYLRSSQEFNPLTYYFRQGKAAGHCPLPPMSEKNSSFETSQEAGQVAGNK